MLKWPWNHPWQFFFVCWAVQLVAIFIARISGIEILTFVSLVLWVCWTAIVLVKLARWLYRRFFTKNE